jgi:ABC-2 type transport system ATP-binding protein
MEEIEARYLEVRVAPERLSVAREMRPLFEREVFGRNVLLFESSEREKLSALGEVRTPSVADLFVAVMSDGKTRAQGVTR